MAQVDIAGRERTARRLLQSSADNSYDPEVDLDWSAPLQPGLHYVRPERSSLYGTATWRRLTPEQRIELGKHEVASVASVGLWFEVILMEMLVRHVYDLDPRSGHAQYALTEIGDETRHTVMFAKFVEKLGTPRYGPARIVKRLARPYKMLAGGPSMFAAVLVAEETTDRLQRESMVDDRVQPLVRMVNRIHVIEEARHVRFAREEVTRSMAGMSAAEREWHRLWTALVGVIVVESLIHPRVYRAVGLDPKEARAEAMANPYYQETRRWMCAKVTGFLRDVGMIGGPTAAIWHQAKLL